MVAGPRASAGSRDVTGGTHGQDRTEASWPQEEERQPRQAAQRLTSVAAEKTLDPVVRGLVRSGAPSGCLDEPMSALAVGLSATQEHVVGDDDTAAALGSG